MNKAELIERIIDTFTDMGSESPEDIAACGEITLAEATLYLKERRVMEKTDLEPSEWLPAEVTPELYMEAENCYIRKCRHDVAVERLAEFITYGEHIDLYHEFTGEYISYKDKIVYPVDFLMENIEFPFTSDDLTMLDLITLGQNSPDFDPEQKFCWYQPAYHLLHSTNTPFEDGLVDATAFAEWMLEHPDALQLAQYHYMDNTDIDYIFRYEV